MLLRLDSKTDDEILSNTIVENESLKETVQITVLKLRKLRAIAFGISNDVDGQTS